MAFDIITIISLVIAFFAGFQKGVVQIFALLLAILAALLLMTWLLPYLTDFFYASLPYSYHPYYTVAIVGLFFVLLGLSFSLIRVLWRREPSEHKILLQKTLGGLTMAVLMIATISTISVFLIRSNIIRDGSLAESKTVQYLKPVEQWSINLLDSIDRNAKQVKQRNAKAKKEQSSSNNREG